MQLMSLINIINILLFKIHSHHYSCGIVENYITMIIYDSYSDTTNSFSTFYLAMYTDKEDV